jgi:hypothetical protein
MITSTYSDGLAGDVSAYTDLNRYSIATFRCVSPSLMSRVMGSSCYSSYDCVVLNQFLDSVLQRG